jgi:FlaA1/EpsC-like NDP-sugar epimerase
MKNIIKKLFLVFSDTLMIIISIWSAYSIRIEKIYNIWEIDPQVFGLFIIILIGVFYLNNIYQILLRYFDYYSVNKIIKSFFLSLFALVSVNFLLYEEIFFPRSISFISVIIFFILFVLHRITINFLINSNSRLKDSKNNILIFGINKNVVSLIKNLRQAPSYGNIKCLIDDANNNFSKRELNGIKIYKKKFLYEIIKKYSINEIIIGSNTLNKDELTNLFQKLKSKNIRIKNLSKSRNYLNNFINESIRVKSNFFDVVDRKKIKVDKNILEKNIKNKTILVSGGGGSIGSELCLEIIKHKPKKIFILEISEINLFETINKIKKFTQNTKIIKLVLGDCNDKIFLESYFHKINIDDVYHAAAYKHVNLGEENPYSMIKNNVFGTKTLVNFSLLKNVKNFTFISSDKAVNPRSILGYTKKLGEKIINNASLENLNQIRTNFTIVRFGNVIGSSGSVIPIFLNQIKEKQPLTLTHDKVKRYFMSISEAVQLVINASYLNNKGVKIYALDMGKQIYIRDIAERIIRLSGYTVKKSKNAIGDIGIKIIGLKKGEKLSEEIALGDNLKKTSHPMIFECDENINTIKLNQHLQIINNKLNNKSLVKGNYKFLKHFV